MKIKTAELTGNALDWAVEVAKGTHWSLNGYFIFESPRRYDRNPEWRYSAEWSQAGPIIEREGIDLYCNVPTNPTHEDVSWRGSWRAKYHRCGYGTEMSYGPTALIAAMRCFVASKLGDEVDIPKSV